MFTPRSKIDPVTEEKALSNSHSHAVIAVWNYAVASAYQEILPADENSATQYWFVVRTLCHEHGVDYDTTVKSARRYVAYKQH